MFSLSNKITALISVIGTATLIVFVMNFLHSAQISKLKAKYKEELASQKFLCEAEKNALQLQCDNDKIFTGGISYEYQNSLNNANIAACDGLRNSTFTGDNYSISSPSTTGRGVNATDLTNKPNNPGGINRETYYWFAGQCEQDRLKVNGLQETLCAIYYTRKQITEENPICKVHIAKLKKRGLLR